MGNHDSKHEGHVSHSRNIENSKPNKEIEELFEALTNGAEHLLNDHLKVLFDPDLSSLIYRFLSTDLSNRDQKLSIDKNRFSKKILPIFRYNADAYYSMLFYGKDDIDTKDALEFVKICSTYAGIRILASDEAFIDSLLRNLMGGSETCKLDQLKNSIDNTCPRILMNLQLSVVTSFKERRKFICQAKTVDSKMLTEFQVWFLQCSLPISYLQKTDAYSNYFDFNCTLLYSSNEHGLSVNRFENKVFNYRSPTILLIKLCDKRLLVVGVDCEWRCGAQNWGGISCFSLEMAPDCKQLESGSNLLYFNTKLRSCPIGLIIGQNKKCPVAQIEGDFSNVLDIEVWGCGSDDAKSAQMSQLQWEKRQAEKHAKVPLPGNWGENPDRQILEMAGIRTEHAQQ